MDVQRDSGCFFKTLSSPEHSFGSVYGKQKYVVFIVLQKNVPVNILYGTD